MAEPDTTTALEVLEKDYKDTVAELTGPKAAVFEGFFGEYEKLYKALLKSHDNEKRLTKKIRDLNAEISANAANVQTAMKLAQEDHQQILTLRRDIEAQQKQVEQSLQKEKVNKDTIAGLKNDIKDLSERIEQGASMTE